MCWPGVSELIAGHAWLETWDGDVVLKVWRHQLIAMATANDVT